MVILFIIGGIGFLYFVPDTRKEMTLAAVGPKEFHQQAVLVLENGKELVLNGIKDTCLSLGQGERLWINDQGRLAYHQDSLQQETPEEGISCESREEANIHWYWRMGAGYG